MESELTPLQIRLIALLRGLGWTLRGGGALAGYHLGHRPTRDLHLFWHGRRVLDHLPQEVLARLAGAGLRYTRLVSAESFSHPTLAWALDTMPVRGFPPDLVEYRDALVKRILEERAPRGG